MTEERPTSFKNFIVVITITALVFLTATFFSYYQVDKKYSMILAFFMFVALTFTTVGIYTGFKHKTEGKKSKIQNRIGLIGNLLIFLFTIALMALAALTAAS
jgi:amino acid transporter